MTFNKSRIRQKLANLANGGGGSAFWTPPKDGSVSTIRLLPIPDSEDPFLELYFHYGIDKQSIFCPKKNGISAKCPLCEAAEELFRGDDADREVSKKLYARPRFYGLMLDRADKEPVAKYWGFGKVIYTKFLNWLAEDEGGDHEKFLDLDEGLDLTVSVSQTAGKSFPDTNVDCKRRESPVCKNKAELDKLLSAVKPSSELFVCPSYDEIQSRLNRWLDSGDEAKESEEVQKPASKETKKYSNKTEDEIDALFSQLSPE